MNSCAIWAPICSARRDFPIPSGPVSVTSRLSDRSRRTSFSSALRPTKLVKWRRVECWTETIFGIMIGRNPLWQNG
ncbi:Uncharacterised protein [Mycobacterium tuberculosis]|nr:Uncharacterised protein [Mycobacterium tuberculosis]